MDVSIFASSPEEIVRALLAVNSVAVIPIDSDIAIQARTFDFSHEDPADRFIAATAFHPNCPLVTVDERLTSLSWLNTIS
ncbi:MAG: PIN domain-containing protein [Fimbriimonadaceae bacterium]